MSALVSGLGARSPAGLNAEQTAMGIRFSHVSPVRTKFENSHHEGVGMSLLGALSDDLEGIERMVALAAPALQECLSVDLRTAGEGAQGKPIVLLGCPSPRPGFSAEDAGRLLEAVVRAARIDADPERSAAFAVGHASFAVAMERALSVFPGAGGAPVLVGSVDSYHDAAAVAHFDEEMRILCPRTPDGFLPAEGAAFVAIRGGGGKWTPFGEVVMAGTGIENTVSDGKPNLAKAATELFVRAVTALGGASGPRAPGWYFRTTNREQHRAREQKLVATRWTDLLDPAETELDELAEHLGDAGAATGGLLSVYTCLGFTTGFAPHRTAVIALSSDGPERGIVAFRAPPERGSAS